MHTHVVKHSATHHNTTREPKLQINDDRENQRTRRKNQNFIEKQQRCKNSITTNNGFENELEQLKSGFETKRTYKLAATTEGRQCINS